MIDYGKKTQLERELGWTFRDRALFLQALTHSTYANEHPTEGPHNERLEFLGDAVIGLLAARLLYDKLGDVSEGELTRRRARVVRREALSRLARELELGTYLRLGQGQRLSNGGATGRVMADGFEALAGAVFIDGGFAAVEQCFAPRLAAAIEKATESLDYKTQLQEACHQRGVPPPRYVVVDVQGPDHERQYTCEVLIGGEVLGRGVGSSKKAAEQTCAQQALERMGIAA